MQTERSWLIQKKKRAVTWLTNVPTYTRMHVHITTMPDNPPQVQPVILSSFPCIRIHIWLSFTIAWPYFLRKDACNGSLDCYRKVSKHGEHQQWLTKFQFFRLQHGGESLGLHGIHIDAGGSSGCRKVAAKQDTPMPTTQVQTTCQHGLIRIKKEGHTHKHKRTNAQTQAHTNNVLEPIVFVKVEALAMIVFHEPGSSHTHPIDVHQAVELGHTVRKLGDLAVLDGEAQRSDLLHLWFSFDGLVFNALPHETKPVLLLATGRTQLQTVPTANVQTLVLLQSSFDYH